MNGRRKSWPADQILATVGAVVKHMPPPSESTYMQPSAATGISFVFERSFSSALIAGTLSGHTSRGQLLPQTTPVLIC